MGIKLRLGPERKAFSPTSTSQAPRTSNPVRSQKPSTLEFSAPSFHFTTTPSPPTTSILAQCCVRKSQLPPSQKLLDVGPVACNAPTASAKAPQTNQQQSTHGARLLVHVQPTFSSRSDLVWVPTTTKSDTCESSAAVLLLSTACHTRHIIRRHNQRHTNIKHAAPPRGRRKPHDTSCRPLSRSESLQIRPQKKARA